MKAQPRDKAYPGLTHKVTVSCGVLYVTVNEKDGKVIEVFISGGKAGGCTFANNEGLARTLSIGLRAGVDLQEYVDALVNIRCNAPTYDEGVLIKSCSDAIGQVLEKYLKKMQANEAHNWQPVDTEGHTYECSRCGKHISFESPEYDLAIDGKCEDGKLLNM